MAPPPTRSDGLLPRAAGRPALALATALIVHAAAATAILALNVPPPLPGERAVEIQVHQAPPPPRTPPPFPTVAVWPTAAMPRRSPRQRPSRPATPVRSSTLTSTLPSSLPGTLPAFGVSASAPPGDQAGAAIPVADAAGLGGVAATHAPGPATGRSGGTATGSAGASSSRIATRAQVLYAVESESIYPAAPRALGIEGEVEATLELDDHGAVRSVKITRPAGQGFDEAAASALKQFRFKPALTSDGRPVPSRLAWRYTFRLKD